MKGHMAAKLGRGQRSPTLPDFVHIPTDDGLWLRTAEMPPAAHAALSIWDMHAAERSQQRVQVCLHTLYCMP